MSKLILGSVQFGMNYGISNKIGKPQIKEVMEILQTASDANIERIDTAQGYGHAEETLSLCQPIIEKFVIDSKFSFDGPFTVADIDDSLKKSIKNLGGAKLGFFYFHNFKNFEYFQRNNFQTSFFINENSKGLAVSVYDEEELRQAIANPSIKAIQLPLNIFDCSDEKINLMSEAKQKGIELFVRSVFLQGLFFMDPRLLPEKLSAFQPYIENLNKIASDHNLSLMSLALGFVRKITTVDGVLVGVDSKKQLISNLNAWNEKLPDEVLLKLQKLKFPQRELLLPINWK